jgi:DNA-binding transcriptional LysR family regulator
VYGDALVRRGLAVFGELQQAVADIAFIANPASGDVNVGCNESLAASLMPAVVEQLASHHPGIAVQLRPMTRPITQEIRHLRERSVDFIVGRGLFSGSGE